MFEKILKRSLYSTSLRFFWHLLRPNWSIIRGTVSLWSMFENGQLAIFERKCHRFRILLTVPRIINQFGRKRRQKKRKHVDYKLLYEFFKNNSLSINGHRSKIRSVNTLVMPQTFFYWICISMHHFFCRIIVIFFYKNFSFVRKICCIW